MMPTFPRRLASALIATALLGALTAETAIAQVTPGAPTNGPAGGTASTTAPSNSACTPSGGTGVISTTRVGPATVAPRPRPRPLIRRNPNGTGAGSSAGLNGSNAPSR